MMSIMLIATNIYIYIYIEINILCKKPLWSMSLQERKDIIKAISNYFPQLHKYL